MLKTNAPIMRVIFQEQEIAVAPRRRQALAQKGQRLYARYCSTGGSSICAESFAEYHLWRGEYVVVRDLLDYLQAQAEGLRGIAGRDSRLQERLGYTETLIAHIQQQLP